MDVITLTGNLLAEWTFGITELKSGTTHRAQNMSFQVGGKGFNVARILKRFGHEAEAYGFAGGEMGDYCSAWLASRGEVHSFFKLDAGVRPGVVIREGASSSEETTFLGKDLPIASSAWQAACTKAASTRPKWLAITGSIPGWQKTWTNNLRQLQEHGISLCADTYGPALADLVELPMELVKINRTELAGLVAGSTILECLALLRSRSPVHNWIITDGPEMIIADFADGEQFEITPASIGQISPTGSGDTFLAALLDAWLRQLGREPSLKHAVACATANAASPGIGDFPIPVADHYLPGIRRIG